MEILIHTSEQKQIHSAWHRKADIGMFQGLFLQRNSLRKALSTIKGIREAKFTMTKKIEREYGWRLDYHMEGEFTDFRDIARLDEAPT